ncbi:XRE family transcriptional regulator [Pseudonocardiaceae bacterium YIM PH 21723]|nr:XRE family transcriptional regulator [Pseudonocardiaceae bacterium YIM PH 21723]
MGDTVPLPSFGTYLRHLRTRREVPGFPAGQPSTIRQPLGRTDLAAAADTSSGYVTKLEQGHADRPSAELVDRLADALGTGPMERQHLHDLAVRPQLPETGGTVPARIGISQVQQEAVDKLHPHPAGYVTDTWDVLYANTEYFRLYRGLEQAGNVLTWFFGDPRSRTIMVEWETEARLTVAWLRALFARQRVDAAYEKLLVQLSTYPEFRRMWSAQEVLMGRHTPYMRVWDLDHDEELALLAQVYKMPDPTIPGQLYIGTRTSPADLAEPPQPA